jgi:receptor protein-tyrosine kinase
VGRLLEEARGAYDYVVVDTPPLLLVPDCRLLSQWVDGFMIVVAARRTPRRLLAEALAAMEPARLVGIVFNGDERPLSGYDKEYYASYYRPRAQESGGRRWLSRWRRARGGERRTWR